MKELLPTSRRGCSGDERNPPRSFRVVVEDEGTLAWSFRIVVDG
jgi:hypothetical protein